MSPAAEEHDMNPSLQDQFNAQIALEHASERAYLQMSAWADAHDYTGAALWLRRQAEEESEHARIFMDHVLDRDGAVTLAALPAPTDTFQDLAAVFAAALEHETRVTTSIGALYAAAQEAGDYASLPLLTRFLDEQVEEEASVRTIVGELRMIAGDPSALLMLDRELPGRRADEGGNSTA
jgi:ferritin